MMLPKLQHVLLLLCLSSTVGQVTQQEIDHNDETSAAPTPATNATTVSPAPSEISFPPTVSPAPTVTPAPSSNVTSPAPTAGNITSPPSSAPTANTTTDVPTASPTAAPTNSSATTAPTTSPTAAPTDAPSAAPDEKHHHHHRPSLWKILGKTLAWLIMIALGVLMFGACMSNRYRIYYYIRGAWYSFLRMEGTQWVLRKLRIDRFFGGQDSSLNEIIFDNDLQEGLLMQDTI
eukprot:CAMPEP_0117083642 /NCGR_PEP_ID=MMETSP0472-20121206/58884_1 /TAXON_ID=693140 ORGANISM="Tiarina fusus, Strain LIS" /NCGR_SAMPLE_ID=MMETSP0472 /ASSEMBLY_ACC=CAM_ASM_000603 /LENGTH=232 /DNA_ID=CAMNT_0004812339 /DNA_START=137 /DNA_END=835 /DNA_ORIENTATION=+